MMRAVRFVVAAALVLLAAPARGQNAATADPQMNRLMQNLAIGERQERLAQEMRDERLKSLQREMPDGPERRAAMSEVVEAYHRQSRDLVVRYKLPVIEHLRQRFPGLRDSVGTELLVDDGKGGLRTNPKHRGWNGDFDLRGDERTVRALATWLREQKLDVSGLGATDRSKLSPSDVTAEGLTLTTNVDPPLPVKEAAAANLERKAQSETDPARKQRLLTQAATLREAAKNEPNRRSGGIPDVSAARANAQSHETYVSVGCSGRPGCKAVETQDHFKKAAHALEITKDGKSAVILDRANSDALQGLGKATKKSIDASALPDDQLKSALDRAGWRKSPQEFRQLVEALKERPYPELHGLNEQNFAEFRRSTIEVMNAAQAQAAATAKQEIAREQSRIRDLEEKGKSLKGEEAAINRAEVSAAKDALIDVEIRTREVIGANLERRQAAGLTEAPPGAKPALPPQSPRMARAGFLAALVGLGQSINENAREVGENARVDDSDGALALEIGKKTVLDVLGISEPLDDFERQVRADFKASSGDFLSFYPKVLKAQTVLAASVIYGDTVGGIVDALRAAGHAGDEAVSLMQATWNERLVKLDEAQRSRINNLAKGAADARAQKNFPRLWRYQDALAAAMQDDGREVNPFRLTRLAVENVAIGTCEEPPKPAVSGSALCVRYRLLAGDTADFQATVIVSNAAGAQIAAVSGPARSLRTGEQIDERVAIGNGPTTPGTYRALVKISGGNGAAEATAGFSIPVPVAAPKLPPAPAVYFYGKGYDKTVNGYNHWRHDNGARVSLRDEYLVFAATAAATPTFGKTRMSFRLVDSAGKVATPTMSWHIEGKDVVDLPPQGGTNRISWSLASSALPSQDYIMEIRHLLSADGKIQTLTSVRFSLAPAELRQALGGTQNEFAKAACSGSVERMKLAVSWGADPKGSFRDKNQTSFNAVYCGAAIGNRDVVRAALAAGSDPNHSALLPDGRFANPLMYAVNHGDLEMMRLLLKSGADPNANLGGTTVLHFAACNNKRAAIELLLSAGAQIRRDTNAHVPGHCSFWRFKDSALAARLGYTETLVTAEPTQPSEAEMQQFQAAMLNALKVAADQLRDQNRYSSPQTSNSVSPAPRVPAPITPTVVRPANDFWTVITVVGSPGRGGSDWSQSLTCNAVQSASPPPTGVSDAFKVVNCSGNGMGVRRMTWAYGPGTREQATKMCEGQPSYVLRSGSKNEPRWIFSNPKFSSALSFWCVSQEQLQKPLLMGKHR